MPKRLTDKQKRAERDKDRRNSRGPQTIRQEYDQWNVANQRRASQYTQIGIIDDRMDRLTPQRFKELFQDRSSQYSPQELEELLQDRSSSSSSSSAALNKNINVYDRNDDNKSETSSPIKKRQPLGSPKKKKPEIIRPP